MEDAVNEGVRQAYNNADNKLRASVLNDPIFERKNTKRQHTGRDQFVSIVPGNTVDVMVAAKGGGSENKSKFVHDEPQRQHRRLGAQDRASPWAPAGVLRASWGMGVGGTAEKAMP